MTSSEITKFFDEEIIRDKIVATRDKVVQTLNEFIPIVQNLKRENLEHPQDSDQLDRKYSFDCGFWIRSSLGDTKRVRFSTSVLCPEISDVDFLTDGYKKIDSSLSFYPELEATQEGYYHGVQKTRWAPLIAIRQSNIDADEKKLFKYTVREYRLKRRSIYDKECVTSTIDNSQPGASIFQLGKAHVNSDSLVKFIKPSLVGIGTSTVYDPTIRQASEISGQVYCFPCYDMWKIFESVYSKFLMQPCKIQFDKISVYKEGDHFENHRDTIYAPNHVATLLIGTDYEYSGGLFKIKDSLVSLFENDYLVFYTDLLHSVELVKSGSRAVLQFKVFLADSPQDATVIYSPTSAGTIFESKRQFNWPCDDSDYDGSERGEDSEDSEDSDCGDGFLEMGPKISNLVKTENKEKRTKTKYNKDQMSNFWENIRRNKTYNEKDLNIERLTAISNHLMAHKFTNKSVAFALYHFYPQKHIDFKTLRGFDKLLVNHLLDDTKNFNITLSLVNIKIKKQWLYDDQDSTEKVDIYVSDDVCFEQDPNGPLKIFFAQKQSVQEIVKLSTDAVCFGNQGACASGQYFYFARMCIVVFN